jgi:dipeptidyl aminopeptidase/acylaminoacyl peptidase
MKKIVMALLLICLGIYLVTVVKGNGCRLIPRELLFGNLDKKIQPRLSPNGTYITYLASVNNVMNIWLKSFDKNDDKPITNDANRGIQTYNWSYDNEHIFYKQDLNGNENWRLYGVSINDGAITEYTPIDGVQVNIVHYNKYNPNRMLIEMNKRDPKMHDVYELDLVTKDLKLVIEDPGRVVQWIADYNLTILAKVESLPEGGFVLFARDSISSPWHEIGKWGVDDETPGNFTLSKDGAYLYGTDARNSNTSRLVKIDTKTGEVIELASDPEYDIIGEVLFDSDSFEPLAVSYTTDHKNWIFFKPDIEDTFERIREIDEGEIYINSRSADNSLWTVGFVKDNGPIQFWIFDRTTNAKKFLFEHQPILKKYILASMEPIEFKARDGLTIHGYLTYPCSDKKSSNDKKTNLPLVLDVHGGPWTRDSWGYNPEVQWLANRGYAVLQVNFRGSKGYGKAFLNAGNKQWGKAMQDDLTDAVHWAIDKGIADPKKVAIYGGSYGGYAALAGAVFTPDLYCCAVDIVGPSNVITLIQTIPPYWSAMLEMYYNRVGNPDTDKEFLESISPLFFVDAIKIPILIAQGANDPRVKQAESEQIVEAMKKKGIKYEYLLFPDEGHGFVRPENRLKFYKAAEKFLAFYLGGRYES